jgi:G3E family GTPase
MSQELETVPVTILTGFLGSGKTTLLNALLRLPELRDTAVIVNEFGEIGLDHLLIEQAIEDAVLLKNGCICCTVRGDIADTLSELLRKRASGELPWFSRIAIETTGLADPAPVAQSLGEACRLDGIVTTADALNLPAQLAEHDTARMQVAFADRLVLTKMDLASSAQINEAEAMLRQLNPRAEILRGVRGEDVFGLGAPPRAANSALLIRPSVHGDISSVLIRADQLEWHRVKRWLDSVLSLRGADIMRIKGVLRMPSPMVLQAIHHDIHPLQPIAEDRLEAGSFLVVIGRNLTETGLRESFRTANL